MENYKRIPRIKVSKGQLVQMLIEDGYPPKEARFQAMLTKYLGSYIKVGDQMVGVSKE